jgi:heterodisulfide reductase subunit C/nitrate reductase gamma subunit
MLLLFTHALAERVAKPHFKYVYSTLDPFQFLRNLFGGIVIVGVAIAIYRRVRYRKPMLVTQYVDRFAIAILAVIMLSGFFLEAAKIPSEAVFNRMLEYTGTTDPAEIEALQAYWSQENGAVFRDFKAAITPELIADGKELSEGMCKDCHSSTRSAFISYPLARGMKPIASGLDRARTDRWLYFIHVLACFIGLAYIPFGKFFHLVTDPLTMIVNGTVNKKKVNLGSAMTRRALELDACISCGTCSRYCLVEPAHRVLKNTEILPYNKLRTVGRLSSRKKLERAELQAVSEGAFICTLCYKCTEVCPTGINLQDQWIASRELLVEKGFPMPQVWVKKFNASEWSDRIRYFEAGSEVDTIKGRYYNLMDDSDVFAPCIQCQTCTNVCPVVAARTDPVDAVDITPQKIMNLLRLGLNDLAMGSRMVWDCVTCYQCQENCPQGIKVTEIIYELRNRGYDHFKKMDREVKVNGDPG